MRDLPNRIEFLGAPTPLTFLGNVSRELGAAIWMKRDDLGPVGLGGNKLRKLEFLLSDAFDQGADCVIAAGAAQSNHCRLTAAACAKVGLECHLALAGETPAVRNGNLLLDTLFGAHLHWVGSNCNGLDQIAGALRSEGKRPYPIVHSGSNAIGALGLVAAASELQVQLAELGIAEANIVFGTSSGGTQAGLTVGARRIGAPWHLRGISIDKGEPATPNLPDFLAMLATATAQGIGMADRFSPGDFRIHDSFLGKESTEVGPMERAAIAFLARNEGIIVDPIYTARSFAGLLDLLAKGDLEKDIPTIFWHTGGIPALFAHAEAFIQVD